MARPDLPIERSREIEGPDISKLNIKELVPQEKEPPSPVEASINFGIIDFRLIVWQLFIGMVDRTKQSER